MVSAVSSGVVTRRSGVFAAMEIEDPFQRGRAGIDGARQVTRDRVDGNAARPELGGCGAGQQPESGFCSRMS